MSDEIKIPSWVGQTIIGVALGVIAWFLGNISKNQNLILNKITTFEIQIDQIKEKQKWINLNDSRLDQLEKGEASATSDRFRRSDALDMIQWIESTYQSNGIKYKHYKIGGNGNL